jgi:predicted GNAT family acetyltransferase
MTDLLELPEKEFPIHITKPDLEQEISELKDVDRYLSAFKGVDKVLKSGNKADLDALEKNFEDLKRDKTFVESQVKGKEKATKLSEAIVNFATNEKYTGTFLANPKFTKDSVGPITLSDILYEDIGVSSTFASGIPTIDKGTYESYSLEFLSNILPDYGASAGTVPATEKCDGGFAVENIDTKDINDSLKEIRATKEELRMGDLTALDATNRDVFNKVEVPVYEKTKVKEFARKWDSDMYLSLARERDRLTEDFDKL